MESVLFHAAQQELRPPEKLPISKQAKALGILVDCVGNSQTEQLCCLNSVCRLLLPL